MVIPTCQQAGVKIRISLVVPAERFQLNVHSGRSPAIVLEVFHILITIQDIVLRVYHMCFTILYIVPEII